VLQRTGEAAAQLCIDYKTKQSAMPHPMPKWLKIVIVCFLCLFIAGVAGGLAYYFSR
jgi:hypothetical protein